MKRQKMTDVPPTSAPAIQERRMRSVEEIMEEKVRTLNFPENLDAYELPRLHLPDSNPLAESVREARINKSWSHHEPFRPNLLTSQLDVSIVNLSELQWHESKKQFALLGNTEPGKALLDLSQHGSSRSMLVGPSGTGKTRFLFEQGYRAFGIILAPDAVDSWVPPAELYRILTHRMSLPDDIVNDAYNSIVDEMNRILLTRIIVLERLLELVKGFEPRHWLAVQLYPRRILEFDPFLHLLSDASSVPSGRLTVTARFERSPIRFVAIDGANVLDRFHRDKFRGPKQGTKYSMLAPLLAPLVRLCTNIVLSGTELNVQTTFEVLASGVGNAEPKLFGITTFLDPLSLSDYLQKRGINCPIDESDLRLFSGRPVFGMHLASALIAGYSLRHASYDASTGLGNALDKTKTIMVFPDLANSETLFGEVRRAAMGFALKGTGVVANLGHIAFERGLCAVDFKVIDGDSWGIFYIKEPLVVRALSHKFSSLELKDLTSEPPQQIGTVFEYFIVFNAQHVLSVLDSQMVRRVLSSSEDRYSGPWLLARSCGDERIGQSCINGEEPRYLEEMLERAKHSGKGISMLFPGESFGADLVLVARREIDAQLLMMVIQCKSCMTSSTPAAFLSLRLPYRQNRSEKPPSVQTWNIPNLKALETLWFREDVSLVFVVCKFPATSANGYPEVQTQMIQEFVLPDDVPVAATPRTKEALEITIDARNAHVLLPEMKAGLSAMREAKTLNEDLFTDG